MVLLLIEDCGLRGLNINTHNLLYKQQGSPVVANQLILRAPIEGKVME
jgi:hypothetical protein